ncbi:TPA: zinc-ribbon domain-containing protein [Candidatus Bathyarchaeota archaeon]|nr:zinc-ribbon domain-containing protein [Candidatus Bathyarchaeota archaeon]
MEPKSVKHEENFCPNCGVQRELSAEFCPNCRSKLS